MPGSTMRPRASILSAAPLSPPIASMTPSQAPTVVSSNLSPTRTRPPSIRMSMINPARSISALYDQFNAIRREPRARRQYRLTGRQHVDTVDQKQRTARHRAQPLGIEGVGGGSGNPRRMPSIVADSKLGERRRHPTM